MYYRYKGSHADLTSDYAAIPEEMKKSSSLFGKKKCLDRLREKVLTNLPRIREQTGVGQHLEQFTMYVKMSRVQKVGSIERE